MRLSPEPRLWSFFALADESPPFLLTPFALDVLFEYGLIPERGLAFPCLS